MSWQGRFYAARGFERIATTYLRDARYCYLRWGADGKARQLEQLYPQIRPDKPILEFDSNDTDTRRAPRSGDRDQGV